MKSRYGKGWYNESERHRLARLGIKTSKVNYQKKGKFSVGVERAKRKHPLLVGMTKGALYGTILQTPFGTLAGMPVGAYTQKRILEAEKKERKYQREHRGKKFGRGWFRESERHRLARLGLKTGTKQKEKLGLIYKTPIPFIPMTLELSPGSKKLLGRRGKTDMVLSTLKKRGWKIKYSGYPPPGQYEAIKGKNYLLLAVAHWKKLKIDKVYIHDKDVGDRLTKLFRRPYPYKIKDYSKITIENGNLNGSVVIDLDEIKRRHPVEALKISNENYKQLYKSGVKLKKNEDIDGDGIINIKDNKPLRPNY